MFHPLVKKYNEKSVKATKVGILIVGVNWCGYCKKLAPEVAKLVKALPLDVPVYFADGDLPEHAKLLKDLRVNSFPSIFVIRGGKPVLYQGERTATMMMAEMCKNGNCKRQL